MVDHLLGQYEGLVYPVAYFTAIGIVGLWEVALPRRRLTVPFARRWSSAFGLAVINTALLRHALPMLAIPFAVWLSERQIGFFNVVEVPLLLAFLACLLALDFSRWTQHWLLHYVPLLWRLHRTHHVDLDYDFTTGLRFHPGDALFTGSFQLLAIALLGPPVEAVLLSELLAVVAAVFAHGNVLIPRRAERLLRKVLVTPDLHRVHHSAVQVETNSNFGGLVPWWDRLLGTYTDQPMAGHEDMIIGLSQFRNVRHLDIHWALANPLLCPVERDARVADGIPEQKTSPTTAGPPAKKLASDPGGGS